MPFVGDEACRIRSREPNRFATADRAIIGTHTEPSQYLAARAVAPFPLSRVRTSFRADAASRRAHYALHRAGKRKTAPDARRAILRHRSSEIDGQKSDIFGKENTQRGAGTL